MQSLGEVRWDTYDYRLYDKVLSEAFEHGERLYSAAYIVPPPQLGEGRKHRNQSCGCLELMMSGRAPERVLAARRCAMRTKSCSLSRDWPVLGTST
ncbi:nucleotide kinase domain-containing protein [Kitasatospora cineracea]|uniref:nucleotide kinase domain-containing protein n=1 Tax=Kitasatospora cineracea TaxID=88074 RepID=UPI00244D4430|nr:nucleotide kinase domain-containing protein [Kitasatospora cineracea]